MIMYERHFDGGVLVGNCAVGTHSGLSPALAGCFAAAVFILTKKIVLDAPNEHVSFKRALLVSVLVVDPNRG